MSKRRKIDPDVTAHNGFNNFLLEGRKIIDCSVVDVQKMFPLGDIMENGVAIHPVVLTSSTHPWFNDGAIQQAEDFSILPPSHRYLCVLS